MFSKDSFKFLSDLEKNNNKEWFVNNKPTYQEKVLNPLKELITDLEVFINITDNSLETKPVTNKAISTIYRDTRYSKNKLPLKTYIGFNFRQKRPDWKYFPAFIFRINPEGYSFGMAIMKNTPDYFYNFREDVDSSKSFQNIIANIDLNKKFELFGGDYKKYLYKGDNKQLEQWYCKKNIYIKCNRDKGYYQSKKDLIADIQVNFEKLIPLYRYFNQIFSKVHDE